MTANFSTEEIKALLAAASSLSIDASDLKPVNPYTQQGPRALAIQMAVEASNPVMAAKWRSDSGSTVSLATAAAEAGISDHNAATRADLFAHDPVYVEQQSALQAENERLLLAKFESAANEMAAKRGVDLEASNQPFNPHLGGPFRKHFEWLNAQAALDSQADA